MELHQNLENLLTNRKLLILNSAACLMLGFLLIRIYALNLQSIEMPTVNDISPISPIETAPTPQETFGIPKSITIPAIKVNAPIQNVDIDKYGNMGVPDDPKAVGWYQRGPRPGETGNAVLAGHLDTVETTAVFWNLRKLKVGDYIYTTDTNNKTISFKVVRMQAYFLNKAPMEEIFGPSNGAHLNLITCNGAWDSINHTYNQRLVVYSERVN